jgi:hypothetical protein
MRHRQSDLLAALAGDSQLPANVTPDLAADIASRVIQLLGNRVQLRPAPRDDADDNLVFVISSFAPEMEPAYLAIAAAARTVGLRAERIKDIQGDYRVTDRILMMISNARLVVADLTHERPNVYFELGYARALSKTVITIIRAGNTAHFDVCDWTYLEYFDSRPLETDLAERFKFEIRAR